MTQTTFLDDNEQPQQSHVTLTVLDPRVNARIEYDVPSQPKKEKDQTRKHFELTPCEYFGWRPSQDRHWWSHCLKIDN